MAPHVKIEIFPKKRVELNKNLGVPAGHWTYSDSMSVSQLGRELTPASTNSLT